MLRKFAWLLLVLVLCSTAQAAYKATAHCPSVACLCETTADGTTIAISGADTPAAWITPDVTCAAGAPLITASEGGVFTVGTQGDGTYIALYIVYFDDGVAADYRWSLYVNDVEQSAMSIMQPAPALGNIGVVRLGVLSLAASDTVKLKVVNETNDSDANVYYVSVVLLRCRH